MLWGWLVKRILLAVASTLIALLLAESIAGYFIFRQVFFGRFALAELARNSVLMKSRERPTTGQGDAAEGTADSDPFVAYPASLATELPFQVRDYRFHPFFDFSGFSPKSGKAVVDYFGFRNDSSDLYLKGRESGDFVVVMTGGSEAAGWTHQRPIVERLREYLNGAPELSSRRVRVLNLAMNSYVISNEINAFVHLAFRLKPDIVVAHTGWNDMMFGPRAQEPFKRLGLNYYPAVLDWMPRLYRLNTDSLIQKWSIASTADLDMLVDGFLENVEKYRGIAQASGAHFIAGIQDYNHAWPDEPGHVEVHMAEALLAKRVRGRPEYLDLIARYPLEFVDAVHSTDASAGVIARAYADAILGAMRAGAVRQPSQQPTVRD